MPLKVAFWGKPKSSLLSGLLARWNLSEAAGNRTDATGFGYALTPGGTVAQSPTGFNGLPCLSLAGAGELGNNALTLFGSGPFSMECWFQPSNLTAATQRPFSIGSSGNTNMSFRVLSTGAIYGLGNGEVGAIAGQMLHLVATYDGAIGVLYVNGVPVVTGAVAPTFTNTRVYIGSDVFNGGQCSGLIGPCSLWCRTLTGSEVVTLYANGTGKAYPFT